MSEGEVNHSREVFITEAVKLVMADCRYVPWEKSRSKGKIVDEESLSFVRPIYPSQDYPRFFLVLERKPLLAEEIPEIKIYLDKTQKSSIHGNAPQLREELGIIETLLGELMEKPIGPRERNLAFNIKQAIGFRILNPTGIRKRRKG